jgi:hypothetical protein
MQKWEYLEVEVERPYAHAVNNQRLEWDRQGKKPLFLQYANELGTQGWEMCGIAGSDSRTYFIVYFRRPCGQ